MHDVRELARVRRPVLFITALAWILILVEPENVHMFVHCPAFTAMAQASIWPSMLLATNPPLLLAAGWVLMLVAMMAPVLIPPVLHLCLSSFARRRARSIGLFVVGYAAIWLALGSVLVTIELTVKSVAPQSWLSAAATGLMALLWQCSPLKQRCLNRCHSHRALSAFGAAADLDAVRFGAVHGLWCTGSCWAWMLFPLLLPRGHVLAMAAVALLIFAERIEKPGPLVWRWRGLGKLTRFAIAQARDNIHVLRPDSSLFSR